MSGDQSRTLLAVVLSGLILIAWNYFLGEQTAPSRQSGPEQGQMTSTNPAVSEVSTAKWPLAPKVIETSKDAQIYELSNGENHYEINNHLNILTAKTDMALADFSLVTGSPLPFELFLPNKKDQYVRPFLQFRQVSDSRLEGEDLDLGVSASLDLLPMGKLHVRIDFHGPTRPRMIFRSRESEGQSSSGFMGLPGTGSYKSIRRYLILAQKLEEILVGDEDTGDLQSQWFGIDSNYHLFAFILPEKRSIRYQSIEDGRLVIDFNQDSSLIEGHFVYVKKNYDDLKSLGDGLHLGVDFGIFSLVAVPLFKGLQILYGIIPNWGVSIVLLTLFIRLFTFPLYYKQMRSMSKMKKIQPKLQKIKEKYKSDPRRQQAETMELFKREKVNPMGGCLPLILQMPIFIAFYKVLTVSAELDNQPFVGWITSLTEKDPYYILPIAVTFLMWLNQKVMPQTATDPTQQKIMNFIPLIFGFIFLGMPSGLNLYILVSTGFGIVQQLFVNKRIEQSPV